LLVHFDLVELVNRSGIIVQRTLRKRFISLLREAIVVMAHKLGLKVIAEGVVTQQQLRLLAQMDCDYAQGFLFSRAVSAQDFEKLLASFEK
jgi:EAL domain-containing protein (putative c-di-GMP-specific phosphodiesterase class I)